MSMTTNPYLENELHYTKKRKTRCMSESKLRNENNMKTRKQISSFRKYEHIYLFLYIVTDFL